MIIADFFPGTSWIVQFGPMVLVWIVIGLIYIFAKDDPEEEIDKNERKRSRRYLLSSIVIIWLVTISLNIFVGEPAGDLFNIYKAEFWFLLVALPLLSQFNFKKSTDGV